MIHKAFSAWICLNLAAIFMPTAARSAERPLKVCLVSGSAEYRSDETLEAFRRWLEAGRDARCVLIKAKGENDLPGLEALEDCDVALFFTRRLTIDGEQLARVRKYVESGRPIVAVRTASHGFQNWLEYDKLVQGGNYRGHYTNDVTSVSRPERKASGHPLLRGVEEIASRGSLYKTSPLADDAFVLLTARSPEGTEPSAWTREYKKARIFYTSLGAPGDFENASFRRLLANALFWTARREIPDDKRPLVQPPLRSKPTGTFALNLRTRAQAFKGDGGFVEATFTKEFPAAETAIVVCDMWDKHWCSGASKRCGEIALRMEPVLKAARAAGVQIVHAPSECMSFYADLPQRLRARLAPKTESSKRSAIAEPPLPIDDSDGGCDTGEPAYRAWTRQDPALSIGEFDAVSDNGDEIRNLFGQLGVKNVLIMGVHTNMCILNRTFAIREMTRRGYRCVLVRDLTDTMYNPARRPFATHDAGTALVVEHIEKYWCPSTTSGELLKALSEEKR